MADPHSGAQGAGAKANVFISYRREDSSGHAGRLCDRLDARFGNARVFMDLQDIAPGQNFARSIDETMATCDCVLAVIGPRWLESLREREGHPEDFVRHEVAAALRRNVTVIPVLVGGARMPSPEQLPPELSALSHRNAIEVRDERFDDDVKRLSDAISALGVAEAGPPHAAQRSRTMPLAMALLVIGIVVAAGAAYWMSHRPANGRVARLTPSVLDGDWIAEMQKEGQRPYRIRLTFATAGDSITGMVRYPTGDGPILDARLVGRTLTFQTSHIPQFESTPATVRYQCEVARDQIMVTSVDAAGLAKGIARRRQQPPGP